MKSTYWRWATRTHNTTTLKVARGTRSPLRRSRLLRADNGIAWMGPTTQKELVMDSKENKQPDREERKLYSSVTEVFRDNLPDEDQDFGKELESQLSRRALLKALSILRATKELSQDDVAKKMKWN